MAVIVGYSIGLVVNYQIGRRYVFTQGIKVGSSRAEFLVVAFIAIFGILINIGVVKTLSFTLWQIDPLLSRLAAIVVTFIWNYGMRRLLVYH